MAKVTFEPVNPTQVTVRPRVFQVDLRGGMGVQGPPGPVGVTPVGDWATATAYTARQGVSHNGSSYVALSDHTSGASTEPGVGASWETVWMLLAEKGTPGTAVAAASTFAALGTPTAGEIRRVTDNVRGLWFANGSDWVSIVGESVNVKEFGAKGNGTTDDTAAIQAALNYAVLSQQGIVVFPPGRYRITSMLSVEMASAASMALMGPGKAGIGPKGATIVWDGAANGIMFDLYPALSVLVQGLAFTSATNAPFHQIYYRSGQDKGKSGSMSFVAMHCVFTGNMSTVAGSAVVAIGDPNTDTQADKTMFFHCQWQFDGFSKPKFGLRITGFNARNHHALGGRIGGCETGIKTGYNAKPHNGFMIIEGVTFTLNDVDMDVSVDSVKVIGCGSETSTVFFKGAPGQNHGSASIENCYYENTAGSAPADDYIIDYTGALHLVGNDFKNNRTGSSVPKIKAGLLTLTDRCSTVVSLGNFYQHATDFAPIHIPAGNRWEIFSPEKDQVFSFGDIGGIGGALVRLTGTLALVLGDSGWALPTLATDVTVNAGFSHLGYRKRGKRVELQLSLDVASPAASKLLFTLPAGFRPAADGTKLTAHRVTVAGLGPGAITIRGDNGEVRTGPSHSLVLASISYMVP